MTWDIVATVIAVLAFLLGIFNFFYNSTIQKTRVFLQLRNQFIAIKRTIPRHYFNEESPITTSDSNWNSIEQYWHHAFSEWFITNKLGKKLVPILHQDLWKDYFQPAIQQSLRSEAMNTVIDAMLKEEATFGKCTQEFQKEIEQMREGLGSSKLLIDSSGTS